MKPRHDGGETSKELFLIQPLLSQTQECPTFDHLADVLAEDLKNLKGTLLTFHIVEQIF